MLGDKVKVLYIAGWGRSGSTILGNTLGQIDGFFSVGELNFIWTRGLRDDLLCGCGSSFRKCEVWRSVLDKAFGDIDHVGVRNMLHLMQSIRSRHLLLLLMPQGRRLLASHLGEYIDNLEKLYCTIQSSTGSRIIVDSSKLPLYGYVLGMVPAVDLYVIHLVRDSRAVAYSWWQRSKFQPDRKDMRMIRRSPIKSSLISDVWNITIEMLWRRIPERYMMLRYEDFIDKPQKFIEHILNMVGEKTSFLPFVTSYEVELSTNHTISGNPNRFQTGKVKLLLDEEWKREMKRLDWVTVTGLTWPLLLRYGYFSKGIYHEK